jgi:hypothetical protein
VLRHPRARNLSAEEAKNILDAAQEIVRTACRKTLQKDCDFRLNLVEPSPPTGAAPLPQFTVAVAPEGRIVVPDVVTQLMALRASYGLLPDRAIRIYVVPEITICNPLGPPPDGIVRGCMFKEHIFVSLTPRRDPQWVFRQAQIWAHEFGHIVTNEDHKKADIVSNPDFRSCLMNGSTGLDHVNLDRDECHRFEAYPKVL